jgi:hypothetical protein
MADFTAPLALGLAPEQPETFAFSAMLAIRQRQPQF